MEKKCNHDNVYARNDGQWECTFCDQQFVPVDSDRPNLVEVQFRRVSPQARIPVYAHDGDSGMDVITPHDVSVCDWTVTIVDTCICCDIPPGYELQVRPKSSLSAKGIHVFLGTIDSGYQGTIQVCVMSLINHDMIIKAGEKIAQLVLAPVMRAGLKEVSEFTRETSRGVGGFGSTGK